MVFKATAGRDGAEGCGSSEWGGGRTGSRVVLSHGTVWSGPDGVMLYNGSSTGWSRRSWREHAKTRTQNPEPRNMNKTGGSYQRRRWVTPWDQSRTRAGSY